jgi:hypothetical protein
MDQEIVSPINRALFHKKALAHIIILNANRNARGVITAVMHLNATAEMALQYCNIIITEARMGNDGVVDVDENAAWE